MDTVRNVGLIGIGLVGSALAERFTGAGYRVTGYDIDPEKIRGVEPGKSPRDVSARCDRIVLSLPDSDTSAQVIGTLDLGDGAIVIDTTTGDPEQMARNGASLAARNAGYLDATIGGSSVLVREGGAILICGGAPETFDRCKDLLSAISGSIFYAGECGAGARMKLVMNLVLGLNRAVLAEGLTYAAAMGIDQWRALEILKAGPAYSRAMDAKGRKMIEEDFTPEARLSQHLKDVRLILTGAQQRGARLPLTALHRELLETAEALGYGSADNSAVIKAFQRRSGDA